MKFGKLVKSVAGVAVTAATTSVNPLFGSVVGSAVGGSLGRAAGKKVQQRTGRAAARVTAPVGALAVPAAFAAAGVDLTGLCSVGQQVLDMLCARPEVGGAAIGAGVVLAHTWARQLVRDVKGGE